MSVQSLPVPSNLRTEGMCYAQNRLSYLLWNGCPQIVSGSLYCLNQRAGRYHLQRQAVLHLYRRPPAVCHLVGREQLQGRVYGAYRDVLAPYLQHPRTRPQYCPCPPQVRQGYPGKENRQKGRQVVCGHLQARPGFWQLYPTIRYSSAPGFGVLPLKTHQFHHGRENRAQNCLTVSIIKLDDVFPDGFGKAATAITSGC